MAHCELLTLEKVDMIELLAEYPKSLKCYRDWSERIAEGVGCDYCSKLGHLPEFCPLKKHSMGAMSFSYDKVSKKHKCFRMCRRKKRENKLPAHNDFQPKYMNG